MMAAPAEPPPPSPQSEPPPPSSPPPQSWQPDTKDLLGYGATISELTVRFLERAEDLLDGGGAGLGRGFFIDRVTEGAGVAAKVKLSVIRPTDTYEDGELIIKMTDTGPRMAKNKPWGGAPPPQCPRAAVYPLFVSSHPLDRCRHPSGWLTDCVVRCLVSTVESAALVCPAPILAIPPTVGDVATYRTEGICVGTWQQSGQMKERQHTRGIVCVRYLRPAPTLTLNKLRERAVQVGLDQATVDEIVNRDVEGEGKVTGGTRVRSDLQEHLRQRQLAHPSQDLQDLHDELDRFRKYRKNHTATLFQREKGTCCLLVVHAPFGNNTNRTLKTRQGTGKEAPKTWGANRVAGWVEEVLTSRGEQPQVVARAKRAFVEDEITGAALHSLPKKVMRRTLDAEDVGARAEQVTEMLLEERVALFTQTQPTSPVTPTVTAAPAPPVDASETLPTPLPYLQDQPPELPPSHLDVTDLLGDGDRRLALADERFADLSEFHRQLRDKLVHLHDDVCDVKDLRHLRDDKKLLLGIDTEFFKGRVEGWYADGGMRSTAKGQQLGTAAAAWLAFTRPSGNSAEILELKKHFLEYCFTDLSTHIGTQLREYRGCEDGGVNGLGASTVWREATAKLDKGLVCLAKDGCVLAVYICPANVSANVVLKSFLWARSHKLGSVAAATMEVSNDGPVAWPSNGTVWSHDETLLGDRDFAAAGLPWYLLRRLVAQIDTPKDCSSVDAMVMLVKSHPSLCRRRFAGLDDQTLLHLAAAAGNMNLIYSLLDGGADRDALDGKGRRARDLAQASAAVASLLATVPQDDSDCESQDSEASGHSSVFSYKGDSVESELCPLAALVKASGVDSESDLLDLTEDELEQTITETAKQNASFKINLPHRKSILEEWRKKRAERAVRRANVSAADKCWTPAEAAAVTLPEEPGADPNPNPDPEPEPEQEPEPERLARTVLRAALCDWSEAQVVDWLRDDMGLPDVAAAALDEGGVDGATAAEGDIEMWRDLGATVDSASAIVHALQQPSARRGGALSA